MIPIVTDVTTKDDGQVFATVKGNQMQNLARQFGVRIGPSRFWFVGDNWQEFVTTCRVDVKATA